MPDLGPIFQPIVQPNVQLNVKPVHSLLSYSGHTNVFSAPPTACWRPDGIVLAPPLLPAPVKHERPSRQAISPV